MTTLPQTTPPRLARTSQPLGPVRSPVGPAGGVDASLSLADVIRVLRTNLWLIILAVLVCGVAGFFVNRYMAQHYPVYQSKAQLRVGQAAFFDPTDSFTNRQGTGAVDMTRLQLTQAALVRRDELINNLLSDPVVQRTTWIDQFRDENNVVVPADAKEGFEKAAGVSPMDKTDLIVVTFNASDPTDARDILNVWLQRHITEERDRLGRETTQSKRLHEQALQRLENQANVLRRQVNDLRTRLAAQGYSEMGVAATTAQELNALIQRRLEVAQDLESATGMLESFDQQQASGITPQLVEQQAQIDPLVNQYRQLLDQIDVQIKSSIRQLGVNHRFVSRMEAERNLHQEKHDRRFSEVVAQLSQAQRSQLEQAVVAQTSAVQTLEAQIAQLKQQLSEQQAEAAEYMDKKQQLAEVQERMVTVQQKIDTLGDTINSQAQSSVSMAANPVLPDSLHSPQLKTTMALAVMIGLALSLGIAFLREILDTSVRSPRDIAKVGQMNLLGMIPHDSEDKELGDVPLPMVLTRAPHSVMAEQFRQVRTRMQQTASLETTRAILVTSPGPGDGKTTCCVNLASGLALNGRRILLVDANFRRPEIHKIFALDNAKGFANCLDDIGNFEAAVSPTQIPNLDVLPTGPKPGNQTELLESPVLTDFIDRALEEYDHVIFDSGPMLFVSETVALAPRVDGVITVVRARSNSRGLLTRMRDQLKQLKAEHLGVILNGVRMHAGGYYRRNIKTYYAYQNGN
ncbi:MAG: polysaccharide biosynthesis tyrosine autokinase [Phycisphaerae bacterium]